jgi:RimJ/RimL family protein N-acetyltransferase
MERMPFRHDLDVQIGPAIMPATITTATTIGSDSRAVTSDWRERLPVLMGGQVTLRELRPSDAASLFTLLTTEEVSRFISPPPTSVEGFERFIDWTLRQRSAGTYVCFAVTMSGSDTAIGIFQVRQTEPGFRTAEWGFAIGSPFWGTGVFRAGAQLVVDFAFDTLGVHRLEARAAVKNGRGNGALVKIGAVPEGVLRRSFLRNGEYLDQVLYAIVEDDWRVMQQARGQRTHEVVH